MPQSFVSRGLALPSSRLGGQAAARHFPHKCQVWKPERVKMLDDAERNPTGLAVADGKYALATPEGREGRPEAAIYPCFFSPTPETDEALVMGRTKVVNIFTLDKCVFPSGVTIKDAWALIVLVPGDNFGNIYVVQGNPQSGNPMPFWPAGTTGQLVYMKRSPTKLPGMNLNILESAL